MEGLFFMEMPDLPLPSACTWISPAHIIHYFCTEVFSGHPFQTRLPGCFLCYIKSVRIWTPVGMLLLPLGDHYRVWQLSLTFIFQHFLLSNKTANIQQKVHLPSLAHTDGRTKAHSWKKNTWVVLLQATCICCPRGALHPFQPLFPFLLAFTWMWFSRSDIIFWKSFLFGYKQAPGLHVIWGRHGGRAHEAHHFLPNGMLSACHKLLEHKVALPCRSLSTFPCRLKQDEMCKTCQKNSQGSSGPKEPAWPFARCWWLKPQLRKVPL